MKKLFSYMMVCGAMMTAVLGFTSCEDDLDVQQAYPFTGRHSLVGCLPP